MKCVTIYLRTKEHMVFLFVLSDSIQKNKIA